MKDKQKKSNDYMTLKESRKIIRYNVRQMRFYEKQKRKKTDASDYTTTMKDDKNLIEIENLKTCFFTDMGTVMSVNGVSFNIPKKKIVGVVGESGCGKSVTSLSIMQLVQAPQGQIVDGEIRFNSDELGYDGEKQKTCLQYRQNAYESNVQSARQGHHDDIPGADDKSESRVHDRLSAG